MKTVFLSILCCLLLVSFGLFVKSCGKPPVKLLYIARDTTWYPWKLMGKEKSLQAFTDDLIFLIADKEKYKVEIVNESTSNLMTGLDNQIYDVVIAPTLPTSSLKVWYVFSDPIFLVGPVLIVREDSQVKTLDEMQNKVIGIQSGSQFLFDIDKYPSVILVPYDSMVFALESLEAGHIDGVVMENVPAYIYTTSFYKGKLKVITAPLTKEGLRLIAVLGTYGQKFLDDFNKDLKEAKEDGNYEKLLKKWDLFNPEKLGGDKSSQTH